MSGIKNDYWQECQRELAGDPDYLLWLETLNTKRVQNGNSSERDGRRLRVNTSGNASGDLLFSGRCGSAKDDVRVEAENNHRVGTAERNDERRQTVRNQQHLHVKPF